jgi:hypothetical protein
MAWTQEEFGSWFVSVLNFAEDQGLDPIGASDMYADLSQYARHTALARLELLDPGTVWSGFLESYRYKRYWEGPTTPLPTG